jgi:hypothetical protein
MMSNSRFSFDQQVYIPALRFWYSNYYEEKLAAVQIMLTMLDEKAVRACFERLMHSEFGEPLTYNLQNLNDLKYAAELARKEILPSDLQNKLYEILNNGVPFFDQISEPAE